MLSGAFLCIFRGQEFHIFIVSLWAIASLPNLEVAMKYRTDLIGHSLAEKTQQPKEKISSRGKCKRKQVWINRASEEGLTSPISR